MRNIELLAPVGGSEQLISAVRSGADAVYFGASSFNARRNAENFTDEDFIGAVRYCRERGVKVYVTLNTLIKDSEFQSFQDTLSLIARSGADAVIVQDVGAFLRIKSCCPDIPVHASTQMAIHNVSGAKKLDELGFSRIVLARELTFSEIKEITTCIKAETEVFVHGAHCMSASGMCYMSSFLGARSGNRGLCAQPCRLNFKHGKREYALSLKDMCLLDSVGELMDAGVSSLKIEGRMKRPEYVASAVNAYKNAVAGNKADVTLLRSVFSRSGFTDGYFKGDRTLEMFGYRTKEDVLSASGVLSDIANGYRNENPLVPVNLHFTAKKDENAALYISDGINGVTVSGAVPETALKVPLTKESVCRSLGKLGSTFYYAKDITCTLDDGIILKASDINAMRREAAEKLTVLRGDKEPYSYSFYERPNVDKKEYSRTSLWLMLSKVSQLPENINFDRLILPLREVKKNKELLKGYIGKVAVSLPSLIYPSHEKRISDDLAELYSFGVRYAYCENLGAISLAEKTGMKLLGGTLLNVINSDAAEFYYSMGVEELTLSPEASFKEIKNMKTSCKTGITVYGYMPLMHFRCCPLQGENGCGTCKGKGELTDRKNEKFTVLCENRQYSVLYNTVPLYVGDKFFPEVSHVLLRFNTETREEVFRITECYKMKKALAGKKTAGLYEREII